VTVILSSKTIVAIEVHQEGNELLVQMGMTLDVHLGHFHSSTDNIYAQKVEYVRASIDIAMLAVGEKQPVGVIIFNLPAEWQWVPVRDGLSGGPRNSGSGDIGYGFVDLERPGV